MAHRELNSGLRSRSLGAGIDRGPQTFACFKIHMTRKISHLKNTLIQKTFQSRVKWHLSFCDIYFVPEIFKFSYYATLAIDDAF